MMKRRRRNLKASKIAKAIAKFTLRAFCKTLKFVFKCARKYKFATAVIVGAIAILIVAKYRQPRGYIKNPQEIAYIETLRKKYSVAPRKLDADTAIATIRAACDFITEAERTPAETYGSDDAAALLLGTALIESDLSPRFQQSNGDAIGLFQIEYGTFRDLWDRAIKYKHPDLYMAILRKFGGNKIRIDFEDLQNNDVLCAIFARMKYAEFPDKIPSDIAGRAAYYKKFYNTKYGASKESTYIKKKTDFLESLK